MNVLPGIVTALLMLAFLGVVAWAYSGRRREEFERLSRVPLDEAVMHEESK